MRKILKLAIQALFSLALVTLSADPAAVAGDAGMLKMRFTQSGNTSSSWPLYVAENKKFFEKNGIQVEVIIIRGATNVVRAVLSETIPIGRINPDYVIGAAEKGAKVKIVAANMEKIPYDIYARPEIKTGAELKGKTLGVSTLTGGTTLMVHEVLEKAYKLKENDYKLLVVGTSPERYAALKGGSVQASFMGPPFTFRAAKDGFRKLANFHEYLGPILFTVDFAHANYIKSNRAEIVRYLKSMIEATRWLYDPKNKEEALALHMKVLKSTRESAEDDYKYLVQEFQPFPRDGLVSKVSYDKTMELRAKEGIYQGKKTPPLSDYVDNSMIEEALKQIGK
ncbi:MAG TPA: ABC transporter substrate-binding protein [Terriglobales bacterium]|jgi:ABC-type nitrate/sulfonate/bicarbonate transport system substrate-binding protein|nr:ABC transporter substrate-binding protein [Terriglobales bacterium]